MVQICNLSIDIHFIRTKKNNVTGNGKGVGGLDFIVLALISLFCIVYLIILYLRLHSIWVGILLLSGALFVTIVLYWIISLTESVRDSAFNISKTLIGVVEARDPNLNGHSLHVQELSALIYENLPSGMKKGISLENLKYAALFHDVGKLGVPESILNKPGKLTPEEWVIMKTHPEIAVNILSPIKSFDYIKDWIRYHHEWINGNGYYELVDEQIPLPAKIIAVADTYSAIVMERSYKPARSYEEAIEILKSAAGSQLDAQLVEIFCSIPKEKVMMCLEKIRTKSENL